MTNTPDRAAAKRKSTSAGVPAGARLPSDHQPAKTDVTGPEDVRILWPAPAEGVESHEYLIEAEALDDAELLEFFTDENFVGALRIMLGAKGWTDYKRNARNESGRVTATGAAEFLNYVLEQVKRGNS
jgi:hypothetical protein